MSAITFYFISTTISSCLLFYLLMENKSSIYTALCFALLVISGCKLVNSIEEDINERSISEHISKESKIKSN